VKKDASEIAHPSEEVRGVCRDSDDDRVLSCVRHAQADYLVSGDDDLLCLGSFGITKVLSPRAFELLFAD
jgi:predicted nucleic acid-binding protein